MNFLIIVTGLNCERYVDTCLDSLIRQTYKKWKAVFISDGSTDFTCYKLGQFKLLNYNNVFTDHYNENMGAAYRRLQAITKYSDSDKDIILLLGMDDELLPNCLERIKKEYENGKWMTYGNWVNQRAGGLPEDFELDFPEEVHKKRDYRKCSYRSTAPNTFYRALYRRIPENDFKIADKWIETTTESEVMFSCMEMCGKDRIGIIKDKIYFYREMLPNGTIMRLGQHYKRMILKTICGRPKKNLIETEEELFNNKLPINNKKRNYMTKVSKDTWIERMNNLNERRKKEVIKNSVKGVDDYRNHINSCYIGKTVLDVGCGTQHIKECLPQNTYYTGIDPFPVKDNTIQMAMEDCTFEDNSFETVYAFAVLDGVHDVEKTINQMKRVCSKNIVILTGIDIEPDQYHTLKITMELLNDLMSGFTIGYRHWLLQDKILLIEYKKN